MAGKKPAANKVEPPRVGAIFTFSTSPHNLFSADPGRIAALAVLGAQVSAEVGETILAVGLIDGLWREPPAPEALAVAPMLRLASPGFTDRLAIHTMFARFWNPGDLRDMKQIDAARADPGDADLAHAVFFPKRPVAMAMTVRYFNELAEGEWRWRHDRAAFEAELAQLKVHRAAEAAARAAYVRDRLNNLTFERLLAETPFENWTPSPPAPSPEFAAAARRKIHEVCRELAALGPKPKKAEARKALKDCVLWFNAQDAAAGHVIETGEREDIWTWLEEMAHVAGHPTLADEVDRWRDW